MNTGAEFRVEARSYDDPLVRQLVAELQQEFVLRYGGPDAAAVDPAEFMASSGAFLVAFDAAGDVVATGAYRLLAAATAEIKRMYVPAAFRRRGYARLMLAALSAAAREAGVRHLVLNTGRAQPEAIALYEAEGWTPIPPFGHYATSPGALFFGREL